MSGMASEEPYYGKTIESGHYGESNEYEKSSNGYGENIESGHYAESNEYDRSSSDQVQSSQHDKAGENVEVDDNREVKNREEVRREEFLRRKALRFEALKRDYKHWDEERNWRPFTIYPREWWKSTPPSHSAPLQLPVNMVIFTFSHGRTCQDTFHCSKEVKRMQNEHTRNGAVDIVFNFMIGGNGQVFEGRGWHSSSRLTHKLQRFSQNALHIAFLGNLRGVLPSDEMFQSARDLMEFGVRKNFISPKFLEYTTKLWTIPRIGTDSEILNILGNS